MDTLRKKLPETIKALFDIRFQRFITAEMISVFYTLILIGLAAGALKLTVDAFTVHWSTGLLHLVVIGPIFFLVGAVIARSVLEFILAVFQIAAGVEELADLPRSMPKLDSIKGLLKPLLGGSDKERNDDDGTDQPATSDSNATDDKSDDESDDATTGKAGD